MPGHDARSLYFCVKTSLERPGHPPQETVIYKLAHSVDLTRPEPWNIDQEVLSNGDRYAFSLVVDVRRAEHEFFPQQPRAYIRFDVGGQGNISPAPPGAPDNWASNTCWLDELTQYAGTWLRISTSKPGLFLDLNVQFAP